MIARTDGRYSVCSFCSVLLTLLHGVSRKIPTFCAEFRVTLASKPQLPKQLGHPHIMRHSIAIELVNTYCDVSAFRYRYSNWTPV
jgi:hypothetical protein